MKKFEEPKMDLQQFEVEDVITSSSVGDEPTNPQKRNIIELPNFDF